MSTDRPIRILFVEDVPADMELAERALRKEGLSFTSTRVETKDGFVVALETFRPDLIVSDYAMPEFDGMRALTLAREHDTSVPFVVLTGSLNEEIAVNCIKAGATDYILKERIARLPFAVKEALDQKANRLAKEAAEQALRDSEERYRLLFDTSMDAVLLTAPNGRIFAANPAACQMFGRTEDELKQVGRNGVVDASDPRLAIALAERARTGSFKGELTLIRKDGVKFPGEVSSALYHDNEGRVRTSMIIRDITERRQAEMALRESEERFRSFIEQSSEGVALLDEQGNIIEWNYAMEQITRIPRSHALGSPFGDVQFQLLSPERRSGRSPEFFQQAMQASFRTGQSAQFGKPVEIEIQSATGVRKAITQTSFPIKTDKGYRLGAIVHDITERKRAEETLRLQSAALNATANAIVITDRTRHVQWSNPAFTALTGYTAEETAGRDLRELVRSDIHDQAFYAEHDQTIDAGQAWHGEIVNRRKDGRLYTEEQTITPVRDADGTVTHMIAIKQDISDRKQREREMEAIALMATALRAAPDRGEMLPVIVHQVANLLKTDAALLHTVDPATGDAIIAFGHGLGADWTGGHIPRGSGIVGHVIATRRPYLTNDVGHEPHNFRPDLIGELGAIACVPLIAQDHIIGALWVGRKTTIVEDEVRLLTAIADIAANALQRAQIVETLEQRVADRTHDLAAANDQLAAANTRLQELDRLKSKFVSDVSHELRTPITALSLNVDLLEYGKPEKREQYMHVIRQQVRRVVQLIEDILNLSRLELGADKVRFGSVALNSLTAQVVAVHQPTAEAKNLTLTFAPYADLPAVRGEESQLAQVITNLIGNAINYTPAGEIHVRTAASDHEVLIEVRDTGLGIAPDDLPHLFERFYRGSRTRQIRGTGLGLAIAMEIVELHDGRIEVESEAGVGTTFRVYLPAHEPIG